MPATFFASGGNFNGGFFHLSVISKKRFDTDGFFIFPIMLTKARTYIPYYMSHIPPPIFGYQIYDVVNHA